MRSEFLLPRRRNGNYPRLNWVWLLKESWVEIRFRAIDHRSEAASVADHECGVTSLAWNTSRRLKPRVDRADSRQKMKRERPISAWRHVQVPPRHLSECLHYRGKQKAQWHLREVFCRVDTSWQWRHRNTSRAISISLNIIWVRSEKRCSCIFRLNAFKFKQSRCFYCLCFLLYFTLKTWTLGSL